MHGLIAPIVHENACFTPAKFDILPVTHKIRYSVVISTGHNHCPGGQGSLSWPQPDPDMFLLPRQ